MKAEMYNDTIILTPENGFARNWISGRSRNGSYWKEFCCGFNEEVRMELSYKGYFNFIQKEEEELENFGKRAKENVD